MIERGPVNGVDCDRINVFVLFQSHRLRFVPVSVSTLPGPACTTPKPPVGVIYMTT